MASSLLFRCVTLVIVLPFGASLLWTDEPARPTQVSSGFSISLKWNFEPAESFLFLTVTRQVLTSNSSEQNIASKLNNGSSHIYDEFVDRAELLDMATVVLRNMTDSDQGRYCCTVFTLEKMHSSCVDVLVLEEPTATVIPAVLAVNQSDVATLTCITSGNPLPNITWTKDVSLILSTDKQLKLKITGKASEGRYRCTASNGVGPPSYAMGNVTVKNHRPVNTSFISCSPDNTAWVQTSIAFNCSAVGSPSITYVFYHNSKVIKKNRSGYHKICHVRLSHAGTYTCEPRNTFGVGERRTIQFSVNEEPAVNVVPRELNVTEGSPALFMCYATGTPRPNVTWSNMFSGEVYTGDRLFMNSVSRNDSGDYQCLASNGISRPAKDTAYLNVFYAPTITNTAGPSITVKQNDSLKLYCHADGNPQPVITWTLLDNNQAMDGEDERLKINSVQNSDSGVYLCTASNFLGNDSKNIVVDVLSTSDSPVITHLESGSSFIHVTWKHPKTKGGITVIGYLVQTIEKDNPNKVLNCSDVTYSMFRCTIHGLKPNATYVVRVHAISAEGLGSATHESIITKYKGYFNKVKTKNNKGAKEGISTMMLVALVAAIAGAIFLIVVTAVLVKRCRSSENGNITKR